MLTAHCRLALRLKNERSCTSACLICRHVVDRGIFFLCWSLLSVVSSGSPELCFPNWSDRFSLIRCRGWQFAVLRPFILLGFREMLLRHRLSSTILCVHVLFCFYSCVCLYWCITWYYAKCTEMFVSCRQWAYAMMASFVDVSVDSLLKRSWCLCELHDVGDSNLSLAVNVSVYVRTENDQWEVTELFEFLVFLTSPWRYRWWSIWGSFAFPVRGTVGSTDRYNDAPDTASNWRDWADEVWRSACTSEFLCW